MNDPEYLDRISLSKAYSTEKNRISDERIYEQVCHKLLNERSIDASEIEVEVKKRIVVLKGLIPDREMKRLAEKCIENIPGVSDVFNFINLAVNYQKGMEGLIKNQARIE